MRRRVQLLSLDKKVDLRGNPCSSPAHVLKALQAREGDAGVVTERMWKSLTARKAPEAADLEAVWTSPPFTHCVFTAAQGFNRGQAERFTKLMLAMDPNDPATADVMRLEGTRRWVASSQEGFVALLQALKADPSFLPRR